MRTTDVVVIGGGQAGLAVSRELTATGIDHVVLERGRVADRWRHRGWHSLSLITPRWMTRLPHWRWTGPDPDGFMTRAEIVAFLDGYARSFAAPVVEHAQVRSVAARGDGFHVATVDDGWCARAVVVATGHCAVPHVLAVGGLHPSLLSLATDDYREPAALPDGGVLVVGASASGVQVADELRAAGRDVVLAVGEHSRVPRTYRGREIMRWLELLGVGERPRSAMPASAHGTEEPSMQLVGRPDRREVDLRSLQDRGVVLAGRLVAADGVRVRFADDLFATTTRADDRLRSVLARVDVHADRAGAPADTTGGVLPVTVRDAPRELDLRARGISTVLWATGYSRSYPWLDVPVLDPRGEIRHDAGRTPVPGLHVVGMSWQTRRSSTWIDGVGADARIVADDVADHVGARAPALV